MNCVVRKDVWAEWTVIVAEALQVKEEFKMEEQRLHVSKARGAYRVAVLAETSFAGARSKREPGHVETDLEKPLSGANSAIGSLASP